MTTIHESVPRSPLRWEPIPVPPRRRWPVLAVLFGAVFCVVSLVVGSFFITVPYYAIAPGAARGVSDFITVPADQRHPAEGEVLLTTVSLGQARAIDAVVGWLDPDVDVVPRERIVPPDTSTDEYRQLNLEFMEQSKRTAIVVALRRLGYDVAERGEGALVSRVVEGSPADGVLQPGDVVVAVNDRPVALRSEAVDAIQQHSIGASLTVQVRPGGEDGARSVPVVLGEHPALPGTAFLGVELSTWHQQFDLPFPVEIHSDRIGGPSAGLAFVLGLIDELTPGELTGGQPVAVTGTIQPDGTVGDVGGVAQKTAAVAAAGIKVFLVPAGEYQAARARAGSQLQIVPVRTLQDALDALGRIGGDLSALGPPPAAEPG